MAYQEDLSFTPLYISASHSNGSDSDYLQELHGSEQFLSRCQDCVWLRICDPHAAFPPATRENNRARKAWMTHNAAAVRQYVRAIVNVVPGPAYEQASKLDIAKAYGVPGTCCQTGCEALAWIGTHVELPGLAALNQAAVLQRITELTT